MRRAVPSLSVTRGTTVANFPPHSFCATLHDTMLLGLLLILVGGTLAVFGVRLATGRARPADLGGMVLAPLGVVVALLGAGRLLSPTFFSGDGPPGSAAAEVVPR